MNFKNLSKAETNQYEQVYYRCQDEKCHATLGTIQILRNQDGWVGGVGLMITQ